MGNTSSKEQRHYTAPEDGDPTNAQTQFSSHARSYSPHRNNPQDDTHRTANARGSRHDLSFISLGRAGEVIAAQPERPRETRQEREARRAERDRQARVRERERSIREEAIDGGFLVTLGTYTGPEDFSKPTVRQLQIERRLAPFWKGLNDHDESWTEAQLVAAVRGRPIPAPDDIPADTPNPPSEPERVSAQLAIPTATKSGTSSGASTYLSTSHPAPFSEPSSIHTSHNLLRGRAKTLASLGSGSKGNSQDHILHEIQLPSDPNVNGVPIEAYLYKEASECPICFLYYPPFLNRTRCCDQPICSECFVQIKRPDPHLPEHEQPGQPRPPTEEAELLVSEVAACPFCVTPEFGITYSPPPFRRGLAYSHQSHEKSNSATSLASSPSSIPGSGMPARRRTTSISANASQVITTDKIRPDWAKKLADARAHVLRKSAAATALHNAAYMLGNQGDSLGRSALGFGRRRRALFLDGAIGPDSGSATPSGAEGLSTDLLPDRNSSRRNRIDLLEDMMMEEAIRQSLAAEDERRRKEEKETKKEEKRKVKDIKKEAKQAEKVAKKNSSVATLYPAAVNASASSWTTAGRARSSSNLNPSSIAEEESRNKGKGPVSLASVAGVGMNTTPDEGPGLSGLNATETGNPDGHPGDGISTHSSSSLAIRTSHMRQLSDASSIASSYLDSPGPSCQTPSGFPSRDESHLDLTSAMQSTAASSGGKSHAIEPVLSFQSLAAMIDESDFGRDSTVQRVEHAATADETIEAEGAHTEVSQTKSSQRSSVKVSELGLASGSDPASEECSS